MGVLMMELAGVLVKAIEEIDILEECYEEQYSTTVNYIKEEIDKYKYGLAIYKFLCSKAHKEQDPHCINMYEKNL